MYPAFHTKVLPGELMRKSIIYMIVLFGLISTACSSGLLFNPTVTQAKTNTPAYTPTLPSTFEPTTAVTQTPAITPTNTHMPSPVFTSTHAPGIGDSIPCGYLFDITIVDKPLMTQDVYMAKAKGIFMGVRLDITYKGTETLDYLDDRSYGVSGIVNGQMIAFAYNWDASWSFAYDEALQNSDTDPLIPGTPFKTYVGFDVNPEGKAWTFHFTPYTTYLEDKPLCSVSIPLAQ
jgi:hypothetical protein